MVLLVDDEALFVETMKKRLARRNVRVISAGGGAEALDLLEEEKRIGVVLLDLKMPGMDGLETLRLIKREHPAVEVIMLTGHAAMETALEGMKLGAFDYMTKPCSIEDVLLRVGEARDKIRKHEGDVSGIL